MRILEQHYNLGKSVSGQPISVEVKGSTIRITAVFRYNRAALRPWLIDGVCQADLIEAAIIRYWSGIYRLRSGRYKGYIRSKVEVSISRKLFRDSLIELLQDPLALRRKRAVPIKIRQMLFMPAHVISPWYRRLWGIIKTGQWESLGTNWSIKNPGIMVLPPSQQSSLRWFERMAAHEAGHLFGLGDAYGALYRYYHQAPGTKNYMMNSNKQVQPREISMLLEAHATGKMQYFPKKWNRRAFANGFKREIEIRTRELERKKKLRKQKNNHR